ncbi:MAG TPA: MmpS family transport accessory protein [Sporichthyaceae bacterium]|nr:MmpS family transport accessory protein [Sporichthyaceae bacterium]
MPPSTAKSVAPPIRGSRRRWWSAASAVAVVGAAAAVFAVGHGSDSGSSPVFAPTTHKVSYEVTGQGTVPNISYSADASGNLLMVMHPVLPWRKSVTIPVGLTAGNANVESGNSPTGQPAGSPPIVCRIWVDDKLVVQRSSGDGFSDAACSTQLSPKQG